MKKKKLKRTHASAHL